MNFLVVGCGSIGKRHIGNLIELGHEQIHVYTPSKARMDETLAKFPHVVPVRDKSELYAEPRDVTLVCTPPAHHLEYAMMAARENSHLFLEKPVSASLDEAGALVEAVNRSGIRCTVGYNYRFWRSLVRAREIVTNGGIGKVHAFRVAIGQYLPDWHPFEDYRKWFMSCKDEGGGILLDLTHAIDYIHWMLGPYQEVSCLNGTIGDLEISSDDYVAMTVRLSSGVVGTFHLDGLSRKPMNTLELIGSDGSLHWDGLGNTISVYDPQTQDTVVEELPMERNEMFVAEMRAFLDSIESGEQSPASLEEGLHALAVAMAARTSSANACQMTPVGGR